MRKIILLLFIAVITTSCGTICGGRMYHAHVIVKGDSNAEILYGGKIKGYGSATFKVPRFMANDFNLTVKGEGCEEQKFNFNKRKFRGWAFAGSLTNWWILVNGIPVFPLGLFIDLGNSVFWKPDDSETNVSKINFRHYNYILDYNKCNKVNVLGEQNLNDVKVIDGPYLEHK